MNCTNGLLTARFAEKTGSFGPLASQLPVALRLFEWTNLLCSERAEDEPEPAAESLEAVADSRDLRDIRQTLQGDGDAFDRLVQRYQADIGQYMWRFTRDRGCWEELVHDVFVDGYFSLASYKGHAPLEHWLRKIATRVGYRFWKQRDKRRNQTPHNIDQIDQEISDQDKSLAAIEAGEWVHAVLARMAARDRLVLTLVYVEGHSIAEAAQLAGWSKTMTKVQLHRARGKLRNQLERQEENENE